MVAYFISAPERLETWTMNAAPLKAALMARWPEVQFPEELMAPGFHVFEWELQMSEGPLQGALVRDGHAVVLEGDLLDCATVAAWFRTTVPDLQPLLFYDEGFGADIPLVPGISADEIVRVFLDSASLR